MCICMLKELYISSQGYLVSCLSAREILFLFDDSFNGYHPPASCKQFINFDVHQCAMDDDLMIMMYKESRKELARTISI